jgi:hypothetical protein
MQTDSSLLIEGKAFSNLQCSNFMSIMDAANTASNLQRKQKEKQEEPKEALSRKPRNEI